MKKSLLAQQQQIDKLSELPTTVNQMGETLNFLKSWIEGNESMEIEENDDSITEKETGSNENDCE